MKFAPSVASCIVAAVYLSGALAEAQVFGMGGAPENHGAPIMSKPGNEAKANEALNSNKMPSSPVRSRYLQSGGTRSFFGVILDAICGVLRFFTFGFVSLCSDDEEVVRSRLPLL